METVLRESFGFGKPLIDRDKGLIPNVRILGRESRNGYSYSDAAIEQLRENLTKLGCYTNHPAGDNNERNIHDRLGGFLNPRINPDDGSLWGDLKYIPSHPSAKLLEYYAENDTPGVGLSLNARGNKNRVADGRAVVTSLTRIYSIDFVDNPGTNTSLRENTSMDTGAQSFDAMLAEVAKAITADISMDKATKKKKLGQLLAMLDEAPAEGAPAMDDAAMMESLRELPLPVAKAAADRIEGVILRERAETRITLAKSKGLKDEALTETFRGQLARAADDAEVSALIQDRYVLTLKAPVSTGQNSGTPPAKTLAEVTAELCN